MRILHEGQQVEAEEVEVVSSREDWNRYQLINGDILSVKLVLVRALKPKENLRVSSGEPLYLVDTQVVVKVEEYLKR